MPKKLNFLGGQQNYNAKTGEYEPSLRGPNGEKPDGFKNFKKQDEKTEKAEKSSFEKFNDKRTGKEQVKGNNETTGRKYDGLFGYSQSEFKKFYEQGKTIIGTNNKFYEIQYSPAQQKFYAVELKYKNNGFAQKGRHHILSPKDANYILGKKVFWED